MYLRNNERSFIWRRLGTTHIRRRVLVTALQNLERAHQAVIHRHQCPRVIKFAAVIGRAKHCDQRAATEKLISVFYHLVRPTDQIDVIFLEEALDDRLAKSIADASVIFAPAGLSFLGVGPQ